MDLSNAKVGEVYWLYLHDKITNYLNDYDKVASKVIAATIIADPREQSKDFLAGWRVGEPYPMNSVQRIDFSLVRTRYPIVHPDLDQFEYYTNVSHQRLTTGMVLVATGSGAAIQQQSHTGGCTCACGYFNEYAVPNSANGKYVCSQCKMFKSVFA